MAIAAKGGPKVAMRTCLACDRPFLSEGPWNRICPRCSERNGSTPPRAAAAHVGAAGSGRDIHRMLGD
ncbi:MAG: hypothetical protein ACLF0G_12500 [Candidatus Brocadiia bacterium]